MLVRQPNVLQSLGILSIAAAIILNRFTGDVAISHFLQGMFIGIGITVLPASMFMMRKRNAVQGK